MNSMGLKVHDVIGRKATRAMNGKPIECLQVETSIEFVPGDIYTVTYPKTGTTILQYMCHLLRTKGDGDDFEDIHQVCPHTSSAWFTGQDLNAPQPAAPRLFKSHRELQQVASNAKVEVKFICTTRDPLDTLYSLHAFREKRGQKQSGNILEFARSDTWQLENNEGCVTTIFDHIATFWKCRDCNNMLLLPYEDLVAEPCKWLRVIAQFMEVEVSDEIIQVVALKTSRESMLRNVSKFDESWGQKQRELLGRVNQNIGTKTASKVCREVSAPLPVLLSEQEYRVRTETNESFDSVVTHCGGTPSTHTTDLTSAQQQELAIMQQKLWEEKVFLLTGVESYEKMRQLLNQKYFPTI